MRVTNWRKKLGTALVAAGMLSPAAALAVDIPLGDASFEDYVVPVAGPYAGYAYSDLYRPTSAWIDDQESPSLFYQTPNNDNLEDDGQGNWLYNAAYAESSGRAAPRTGNQAMHGRFNYSSQETSAANVFEVGRTYTFSVYAQGDFGREFDFSDVYLYLFDGSVRFSEDNSLVYKGFSPSTGDFIDRPTGATAAQSKALWQRISISRTVAPGASEAGHPIGVGFYGKADSAVDDASLEVASVTLEINTSNGHARIVNETGKPLNIDYYQITSASGSLRKSTWMSIQDQNAAGYPAGNGTGNGWEEADLSSDNALAEGWVSGNSQLASGGIINLWTATAINPAHDILFQYGNVGSQSTRADFDANGLVDGADLLKWQRGNGSFGAGVTTASGNANTDSTVNDADLAIWKADFGHTSVGVGAGAVSYGYVRYVTGGFASATPEPGAVILAGAGLAGLLLLRRKL